MVASAIVILENESQRNNQSNHYCSNKTTKSITNKRASPLLSNISIFKHTHFPIRKTKLFHYSCLLWFSFSFFFFFKTNKNGDQDNLETSSWFQIPPNRWGIDYVLPEKPNHHIKLMPSLYYPRSWFLQIRSLGIAWLV